MVCFFADTCSGCADVKPRKSSTGVEQTHLAAKVTDDAILHCNGALNAKSTSSSSTTKPMTQ